MRVFVDKISANKHTLTGDAHRHVAYSLRARVGEEIVLCAGDGYDCFGKIVSIEKDRTVVEILSKETSRGEPSLQLTVFCALPNKSDKLELVVQKLTELGVVNIQPITTKFVQARADSVKLDRLARIAEEAAKQCGRGIIPTVHAPVNFEEMTHLLGDFDLTVFPYEHEKQLPLKTYLKEYEGKHISKVALIIGSEGGFAEEEAERLRALNVRSVTLGSRILRTETANIAVTAAIMYELDQWQCGGER